MAENRYVGATSPDRFERKRLQLLREVMDPITHRHLKRLELRPGWRCLDVGAGDGSIAEWMVDRVKPEGRVVATDIDPRFLEDVSGPHLEVRQHDVLEDELEHESYDLVHCRTLLMHLNDPEAALEKMVRALKPGGWLLAEETDYRSFGAADPDHRLSTGFDRILGQMFDLLLQAGVTDAFYGRRLRGVVEEYPWRSLGNEGASRVFCGGEAGARYHRMNFCELVRPHLPEEAFEEHDFDLLERAFNDPSFCFVDRTLFSVWGQKPSTRA